MIKDTCVNLNLFVLKLDNSDIFDYMLKEKRISFVELYLIFLDQTFDEVFTNLVGSVVNMNKTK